MGRKVVAVIKFEQFLDEAGLLPFQLDEDGAERLSDAELLDVVAEDLIELVYEAVRGGRLAGMVDVSFEEEK